MAAVKILQAVHESGFQFSNNAMAEDSKKRLLQDFKDLQKNPLEGAMCSPQESNILMWSAVIFGPDKSVFQDGTFQLTLTFSHQYPFKAPTVTFSSPPFHPNICGDSGVCQNILEHNWSPAKGVRDILTELLLLLTEPNLNHQFVENTLAAKLYQENRTEFNSRVRESVEQSWDQTSTPQKQGHKEQEKPTGIQDFLMLSLFSSGKIVIMN